MATVSQTLANVVQDMDELLAEEEAADRAATTQPNTSPVFRAAPALQLDEIFDRLRSSRAPRTPHLVVRLPTGGYSYAPSHLYSPARSPRRRLRRTADRPLLRQIAHNRSPRQVSRPPRGMRLLARPRGLGVSIAAPQQRHESLFGADTSNLVPVKLAESLCPPGRCSICLVDFKDGVDAGEEIVWVNCQSAADAKLDHVYHMACIESWIQYSGRRQCPQCRGSF